MADPRALQPRQAQQARRGLDPVESRGPGDALWNWVALSSPPASASSSTSRASAWRDRRGSRRSATLAYAAPRASRSAIVTIQFGRASADTLESLGDGLCGPGRPTRCLALLGTDGLELTGRARPGRHGRPQRLAGRVPAARGALAMSTTASRCASSRQPVSRSCPRPPRARTCRPDSSSHARRRAPWRNSGGPSRRQAASVQELPPVEWPEVGELTQRAIAPSASAPRPT